MGLTVEFFFARVNFVIKKAAIFISVLSAVLIVNPVFAEDATSSSKREQLKQKVETRKDKVESKVQTLKEKIASREAALKKRLAVFKDKKKAEIAERVSTNLNKLNSNRTEALLKHLKRLSEILSKAEKRAGQTTAVSEAKTAISEAEAKVSAQSEKDYTLTISSESKAKADAKKMRDQLHADLTASHEAVKGAKDKVVAAIQDAKGKEAESGGQ